MQPLTSIQKKALELTGLDENTKSSKGWIYGKCPFCNHEFKFGMKFNDERQEYKNHLSFNCFRGSCKSKGTEYELFKHYNVLHLLSHREFIPNTIVKLDNQLGKTTSTEIQDDLSTEIKSPPAGWVRVYTHPYLIDRGWEEWQFFQYHVGITELYSPLKDYVILLVMEDGENRGYVARSTRDSTWIEDYNAEVKAYNKTVAKDSRKRYHPKYSNESGIYFERLLLGIDEITTNTKTVILVEGPLDKSNVDRILKLNLSEQVKCLCTFGKKISKVQMIKMKMRGIENVLLLYDPDAIDSSKQYSFEIAKLFNVKISTHPSKDPGEMTFKDIQDCISVAKSSLDYYVNMVGKSL